MVSLALVALLAASAVSASPVHKASPLKLSRRELGENATREDYEKVVPAECKDACTGAAFFQDSFWSTECLKGDNLQGDACGKIWCDAHQGTLDCQLCAVPIEARKQGYHEDQIEDLITQTHQMFDIEKKSCDALKNKRSAIESVHAALSKRAEGDNREDYEKLVPAECKSQCTGAAWSNDGFWSNKCVEGNNFQGAACQKVFCDTLQGTYDCQTCAAKVELRKNGADEAAIKEFDEESKSLFGEVEAECKPKSKRDFHPAALVKRASKEEWLEQAKKDIPERCHEICKATVLSGDNYVDVCTKSDSNECDAYTCSHIDPITDCTLCIVEDQFQGYSAEQIKDEKDLFKKQSLDFCKSEGLKTTL